MKKYYEFKNTNPTTAFAIEFTVGFAIGCFVAIGVDKLIKR